MVFRKLLWVPVAVMLVGCASETEFDRRAAAWIGRPEGDVVASLGIPDRTYSADGRRFIQYDRRRLLPGDPPIYAGPFGGFGRGPFYGGFGGWGGYGGFYGGFPPRLLTCDLTFELRGDRVVSFTHRGNDCVATSSGTT